MTPPSGPSTLPKESPAGRTGAETHPTLRTSGWTVVSFGQEPWGTLWKRNQSMMYHLSQRPEIRRMTVVNSGVWLTSLLFGRGRARQGLYPLTWKTVVSRSYGPKLRVTTPIHWIPFSRSWGPLSRLDTDEVTARLRRMIGAERYVAVVNNIDSEMEPIIDRILLDAAVVIFDWSDDFVEYYRDESKRAEVRRLCEKYMRRADLVLSINERLAERAREFNTHSHVLMNATNFPVIDRLPGQDRQTQTLDWPKMRGPVVGYMGWFNENRIDLDIVDILTSRLADWSFVFIGPLMFRPGNQRIREILSRPNVHYFPPVPYLELPAYLQRFDVCILPFLLNDHTRGNDPIKIYDYLSFGKPVVSTRTAGIERVEGAVQIADSADEFVRMVQRAARLGEGQRDLRRSIADKNAWPVRVEALMEILRSHISREGESIGRQRSPRP